jgi:GNAT superfamily N-acetyltransferase
VSLQIRQKTDEANERLTAVWTENYGGVTVVSRGRQHEALDLPGLVAEQDGQIIGALTWHRSGDAFEVVTLDAFVENRGVGTALLQAAVELARREGARRAWLVTSNDNIHAIRFYQRQGWDMAALHRDAVTEARKLKPEIPLIGGDGIAVRHEIEFELSLDYSLGSRVDGQT